MYTKREIYEQTKQRTLEAISNPFYSPFQNVLVKGEEEDGKWIVYLQASNELTDQDGEIVEMAALKKAADYYLEHGVLSWDHKHKMTYDPGFIIGEPLEVRFSDKNETFVKGFLYKSNDIAQKVWKNILSGATKIGASIGGGILEKADNRIRQVIWDETALTHKPVNDKTLGNVSIVPFSVFAKALMAGGGVNPEMFQGGRSLVPESLQGVVRVDDVKDLFKNVIKRIKSGYMKSYDDLVSTVYDHGFDGEDAVQVIQYIAKKIPDVIRSGKL